MIVINVNDYDNDDNARAAVYGYGGAVMTIGLSLWCGWCWSSPLRSDDDPSDPWRDGAGLSGCCPDVPGLSVACSYPDPMTTMGDGDGRMDKGQGRRRRRRRRQLMGSDEVQDDGPGCPRGDGPDRAGAPTTTRLSV